MQLTDNSSTVAIPLGWYDCCDGLYNPNKRVVYTYDGITFLRNAGKNIAIMKVVVCFLVMNDNYCF